jgi:Tol biopolymer transport system component
MASLAVAVVLIAAMAVPTVRHLRETPPPSLPETRTEIVTPATADPISFALSPDGRQIVFVASGGGASRLWLRSLASTTAQPLAGTEGAASPFWSPDSRSVGFFAEGKLKRLDIGGGTPQTLATVNGPRGGTWNADGVILFGQNLGGPLFRVLASGGQAVAVTKLDRQSGHRYPSFLPDGRQFLFYAQGTLETTGIYLGSVDSVESRRLTAADTAGVYLSSGWLLWVRAGTLVAQRLDLERKALTGDPVTLADPVGFDAGNSAAGAVSVSAAGLVAYRAGGANRRQLAWFDRSGKALGVLGAPDENDLEAPRISPDGRRVAVARTVQGNADIWLLDGTRTSRFTVDTALDRFPIWSPDGSRIAFQSNRKSAFNIYQKPAGGAGAEELLVESPQDKYATDWSTDGRFILYHSNDPQTGRDLWVLPLEGDRKPWVFLKTSFEERVGQFSPDGRWVAYTSNESGRYEIYIRPFAAPAASGAAVNSAAGQWQVSTAGGIYSRWRPDGKELYYIGPNGEMMAAPIAAIGTTLEPGAPVALFPTRILGGGVDAGQGRQYDVTRDGRFLINTVLDDASSPITLLQNWRPEPGK